MAIAETPRTRDDLEAHGIAAAGTVCWQPTTSQLYTHALARGEARIAEGGPLAVDTGIHTGRSPKDKFIVREAGSEARIWWSDVNAEISEDAFEGLRRKVTVPTNCWKTALPKAVPTSCWKTASPKAVPTSCWKTASLKAVRIV